MICGYKAVFVFSSHFIWWGVCRLYFSHVTCTHKRSKAKKMKKLQPSQFMLPYNRIYLQMRHAMNKQMFRFVSLRFSWIYVLYTIAWLWNDNTTMKEQKRKKSPMTSSQAPVRLFVCLFCRIFYKSRLDVIYPNNLLLSLSVCVCSVSLFRCGFQFRFHCGVANVFSNISDDDWNANVNCEHTIQFDMVCSTSCWQYEFRIGHSDICESQNTQQTDFKADLICKFLFANRNEISFIYIY